MRGDNRRKDGKTLHAVGPTTENARRCIVAVRANGTKKSPREEERRAERPVREEEREQRWKISIEELYPRRFAKRESRGDTECAAGGEASVEYAVCRKIRYH